MISDLISDQAKKIKMSAIWGENIRAGGDVSRFAYSGEIEYHMTLDQMDLMPSFTSYT